MGAKPRAMRVRARAFPAFEKRLRGSGETRPRDEREEGDGLRKCGRGRTGATPDEKRDAAAGF